MVNNTINATYTETYDLNTAIGELSMLGIHTPQAPALKTMFKGFFQQYKKFKILGCNLQMVCASQQALSPDMVGLSAGEVDPRDVLNPILFKAVTGEKLNALLDQIYNKSEEVGNGISLAPDNSSIAQHVDSNGQVPLDDYYALLADNTWRKEHPQKGLTVMGLRPFVHKVVTTQPFYNNGFASGGTSRPSISGNTANGFGGISGSNNHSLTPANPSIFVSDGVTDMPWMDTVIVGTETEYAGDPSDPSKYVPVPNSTKKVYTMINDVPRVYMGVIVLPPAIQQRLFFRMQIVWHVQFRDFRPAFELTGAVSGYDTKTLQNIESFPYAAFGTYFNLYHSATPEVLTKQMSSFDASGLAEVADVNQQVQ